MVEKISGYLTGYLTKYGKDEVGVAQLLKRRLGDIWSIVQILWVRKFHRFYEMAFMPFPCNGLMLCYVNLP